MDIYLVTPVGPFPTAIGAAFGTFTTRQDISPQPLPTIQGGTLRLGSKFEVKAEGEFSTTGTPTLSIGCYVGTVAGSITTVLAEYTAAATGTTAASWPWRLEYSGIVVGPLGTACSVVGNGTVQLGTSLTAYGTGIAIPSTLALRTITLDSTIARAIGVCATWGTSSASNTIKTYKLDVTLLN
jgi:hypothetical protein